MSRRSTLFLFLLLFLPVHQTSANIFGNVVVQGNRVILEANDADEEISLPLQEYEQYLGYSHLLQRVSFYDFKRTFQEISTHLTPALEEGYEVFVLVNVHEGGGDSRDYVPAQFMRVLRKTQLDQKVFIRDRQGVIINIHPGVLGYSHEGAFEGLESLIPVSSGDGDLPKDEEGRSFVDTPTGIYRINTNKSIERRFQKDMYHGLYFDLVYPSGWESGLAIHGTNENKYPFLGYKQSSRGCIRTTQNAAYILYKNLMSIKFMSHDLPDMNRYMRLKSELRDEHGHIQRRFGSKGLFIIFYGYENEKKWNI